MNIAELQHKLAMLPNKRGFAMRHKLPTRTMWRLISGDANPTASTVAAFVAAVRAENRLKARG